LAGGLLVLPLHLLLIPLSIACGVVAGSMSHPSSYASMEWMLYPLVGIGVSQWLYLGPAIWFARRRGKSRTAAGLAIGGGITLLLNSACFGALWIK
jgi:hypothetical protein